MGLAAVVTAAAVADATTTDVLGWVYRAAAGLLAGLGTLTALTGARTAVVWFEICPVLLVGSAALLVAAGLLEGPARRRVPCCAA